MRFTTVSFVAAFCLFVSMLSAQPLADCVPDDAIIYIGWCGSDSLPSGYEGSHLKAVLEASNVPAVFEQMVPALVRRTAIQNAEAGQGLDLFTGIVSALWRHPTAICFRGIELSDERPMPRIAVICQAGKDLEALTQRLTNIKQLAGDEAPMTFNTDADLLTVHIGAPQPGAAAAGGKLKDSASFKAAMDKLQPVSAAAVLYLDGEKLMSLAAEAIQRIEDPKVQEMWPKIREASGLEGLKRAIWTSGFQGKDWMDQLFVDAPMPRKGLLAMCDAPPLSDDLLRSVPTSATYVTAGTFDLAALVENIRSVAGQIDREAQRKVDQGLGFLTLAIGRNFQRDILDPLGSQWACYVDPGTSGLGFGGLVLVNKLDDPAKAEQGLMALTMFISNSATSAIQRTGFQLPTRQTTVHDVKVNYLATPLITPSWAVKDGNLYVALFPQVAASAGRVRAEKRPSILDNPEFVEMRKQVAGDAAGKVSSIQYVDLRKTALEGYQSMLVVSRLALGFADMWGVKSPELVVPALEDLLPHLAPMASAGWSDDSGFHMKTITPFPGAELLSGGQGLAAPIIASQAMGASILVPSLNRARETANRVKCASNLRQIGQAMLLHSNDNRGAYPEMMGELLKQDIPIEVFVCPSGTNEVPANVRRADLETRIRWVNENADYVYLGAGKTNSSPADMPLVYEKLDAHDSDGMNVLFGDGHVEFFQRPAAMQLLQGAGIEVN